VSVTDIYLFPANESQELDEREVVDFRLARIRKRDNVYALARKFIANHAAHHDTTHDDIEPTPVDRLRKTLDYHLGTANI